jgi:hypothetical protein
MTEVKHSGDSRSQDHRARHCPPQREPPETLSGGPTSTGGGASLPARGMRLARARLDGSDEPGSVVDHAKGLVGGRTSRIRSPGGLQQLRLHNHSYDSANRPDDGRDRDRVHSPSPRHTGAREHDDPGTAAYGRTGPATVRAASTTSRPLEPGRLERLCCHAEPESHSVLGPPVQSQRDHEILRARTAAADEVNSGRLQHLRSESELDNTEPARSRRHPGRAHEHLRPAALGGGSTGRDCWQAQSTLNLQMLECLPAARARTVSSP